MDEHSIWIGVLDLDGACDVREVNGPLLAAHRYAKLLVRLHRAPVGYVQVPVVPHESFAERAQAAAETDFAHFIQQHTSYHEPNTELEGRARWASMASCPQQFPAGGEGITVAVCTRDRPKELADCLNAMQHFNYEPLEILVVDNAPSTDDTLNLVCTMAKSDSRIRYTLESSPGLSRARNHALAHARYELIAFTDDDTLADAGWPNALAAGFRDEPETVCVTGFVAPSSLDTNSERYFEARYYGRQTFNPRRYDLNVGSTQIYPYAAGIFGTGANFGVRRDAVVNLGGFDPLLGVGSQGRGGEDLDMFLRVIQAGGRISYMPSAIIWHRHRANPPALREQVYSYGHGLGAYLAKHIREKTLRTALLRYGFRQAGLTVRSLRRAALRSQLGVGATTYALSEVRGVVAGAISYWRAAR